MSSEIRDILKERAASFDIVLDDVSITSLTFGREFAAAIEAKQIAAQEAERARFVVEMAEQEKRTAIIQAQVEHNPHIHKQCSNSSKFFDPRIIHKLMPRFFKIQGEAKSADLIGNAIKKNPAFIALRRIEASKEISQTIAHSSNKVYLASDELLLNLQNVISTKWQIIISHQNNKIRAIKNLYAVSNSFIQF